MSARPPSSPPAAPAGSLRIQLQRSDIVRASIEVFARLGAETTRVEDLLEAAGVARRTFYKYFRSKEDVLGAVYDLVTRELVAAIEKHGFTGDDPTAGIRATLDVYLGFHADNHRILRVLIERSIPAGSPLAPLRRRFRDDLVGALDKSCRAATGRSLDPYVFVALVSGLEGLSLELVTAAPSPAAVARVRRVINGLFDAILRSAGELPPAEPHGG